MSPGSTFTARLSPRDSMLLWLATMGALGAFSVAFLSVVANAQALVTWCQSFVIAAVVVAGVLGALAAAASVRVAWFAQRELRASAKLRRELRAHAVPPTGKLQAALAQAAVDAPCQMIDDDSPYAMTVGLFRPRIVISASFVASLTLAELRAVLRHEAFHAGRFHPLRAVAWELLRRVFFFLPSLADVARHFALMRELDADRAATTMHRHGHEGVRALASALLKTVALHRARADSFPATAAPFGHLRARIAALANGGRAVEFRLSVRRALASVAAVVAVLTLQVSVGASTARAETSGGGQCAAVNAGPPMSELNFSPYFSIRVPQMSPAPSAVQSVEIRP